MASTPQGLWNRPLEQWKVTELKDELRRRKMPIKGLKDDLIKRLEEAFRAEDDTINQDHDMREDHPSVPDIHIPAPEMEEEHNVEEVKEEKNVEHMIEKQCGEEMIGDEEMKADQNDELKKEEQNVEEMKGDEEMKEDQNVEDVKGDEEMREEQNIQQVKEIKEEGNVENMKEIKGEGNEEDKKEIKQEENSETKMDEKPSSTLAGEKPNPCPNNRDAEGVYVTMVEDNGKMEKDGSISATDTGFERKNGSVPAAENNLQESCGNDVNLGSQANETNQNSILQWECKQHIATTDEVLHDHSALKETVSDADYSKNEEEPTNACFDMDQSKPANACDSIDQLKPAEEAPVVVEPLRQDGTSEIVSQENQKEGDGNNAEAVGDKRKKEDEDVVEPIKRQRRWNSGSRNVPKPLMQDDPSAMTATSLISPVPSPISLQRPVSAKPSITRSDPPTAVEATNQKERVVPSSQRPPTSSLRIDKFLRPFTIKAVHELLGKTGTITNFWMDHIKTHCYVTFSSVDEAIATRKAVYNLQWPPNGGRLLVAEFVEPEEVKRKEDGDQQGVPTAPQSNNSQQAGNFQTKSHQIQGGPGPSQQSLPLPVNVKLPPPPPIAPPARERQQKAPKKAEQPTVTLDDLFRKTKSTPRIYYLPLSEEEVAIKVAKITEEMVD